MVLIASLTMLDAVPGFPVWNFPSRKIFPGDGGAYLGGFWLAEALFGFRIDQADILYPFHSAARQATWLATRSPSRFSFWHPSRWQPGMETIASASFSASFPRLSGIWSIPYRLDTPITTRLLPIGTRLFD